MSFGYQVWFRKATGAACQQEGHRQGRTRLGVPGSQHDYEHEYVNVVSNIVERWRYMKHFRFWNQLSEYTYQDDELVEVIIFQRENNKMIGEVTLSFGQVEFLSSLVENYGEREREHWIGSTAEEHKKFLSDIQLAFWPELADMRDEESEKS